MNFSTSLRFIKSIGGSLMRAIDIAIRRRHC